MLDPLCVTAWLLGPCTLLSLISIIIVCLVAYLFIVPCIAADEFIQSYMYNDPVIYKKDDDAFIDWSYRFYFHFMWHRETIYVSKYGTALTIINTIIIVSLLLIYLVITVIIPIIGISVVKISRASSILSCTTNTTIGTLASPCLMPGCIATFIIMGACMLLYGLSRCIRDVKNSIKPPDEVSPIKTRQAAELANYNTL